MEYAKIESESWLPLSNDSRDVLAAMFNEFFRDATVEVIPSDLPVSLAYEPMPETINALGTLEVRDVNPDQAKTLHRAIHSPVRANSWRPGGASYMWPTKFSFRIYLVTRKGESSRNIIFPIFYGQDSDIDAILAYSKNPLHQSAYDNLGLTEEQMIIKTYTFEEKKGWTLRA